MPIRGRLENVGLNRAHTYQYEIVSWRSLDNGKDYTRIDPKRLEADVDFARVHYWDVDNPDLENTVTVWGPIDLETFQDYMNYISEEYPLAILT